VGVLIQPVNQGRVAANAEVRNRGREFFFGHAVPPETGYIIFIKYVILGKGLSEKLKKKRTLTQQYFSFHLINKYNKDIDNIFIGVFKSVFMAKSRVPLMLRASFSSTVSEQPSFESVNIDLSAYVDALSGKVLKINKVTFMADSGSGLAFSDADFDSSRGGEWVSQLVTGTQTAIKGANDDRVVAAKYFYVALNAMVIDATSASAPSAAAGTVWTSYEITTPNAGFYVAADTLTFAAQHTLDMDSTIRHICVIEAERIKLSAADVNFLLVNQTLTG